MQQHDTWWFSYYRRPGLLIVGDVMMALAVVVPYTWDYHGHWLKCLSFTIGKSFLFFLEKTLLDDKLNMCECMWKTVPVLLSLPSLINSSLVSGIETNHLLILCKSFRTGIFIPQILTKHLLCAKHCLSSGDTMLCKFEKHPVHLGPYTLAGKKKSKQKHQ